MHVNLNWTRNMLDFSAWKSKSIVRRYPILGKIDKKQILGFHTEGLATPDEGITKIVTIEFLEHDSNHREKFWPEWIFGRQESNVTRQLRPTFWFPSTERRLKKWGVRIFATLFPQRRVLTLLWRRLPRIMPRGKGALSASFEESSWLKLSLWVEGRPQICYCHDNNCWHMLPCHATTLLPQAHHLHVSLLNLYPLLTQTRKH